MKCRSRVSTNATKKLADGGASHLSELIPALLIQVAHVDHERHTTQEDSVVPVLQQTLGLADEVLDEVGHTLDDPDGAESSLEERGARESAGRASENTLASPSCPRLTFLRM